MTGRAALVALGALVAVGVLATPVSARPSTVVRAVPCPNGRPAGPHVACTGPVTHRAGGGGGVVTIVVSALVGLAVAGVAAVFVRRRLALDAARPLPAPRPKRPS